MGTALLRGPGNIQNALKAIHETVRGTCHEISRIAVALYDPKVGTLKTFAHSSSGEHPLDYYEVRLNDVPSLKDLAHKGTYRVIDDLAAHGGGAGVQHATAIGKLYRSSLTVPFYSGSALAGFIFFNSGIPAYFSPAPSCSLVLATELIASLVLDTFRSVEMLNSIIRVAKGVSHYRDEETGAHLDRVANYARLIALRLAEPYGLNDEYIGLLHLFAPLHDVGKVAIPDGILLKPGRLDPAEFAVMKTHTTKGVEIIDNAVGTVEFVSSEQMHMLRNIVHGHHESWDGGGYPRGLKGDGVPLEAAIVAVADVFDALTSERPYKKAWAPEAAFALIAEETGRKFHPECARVFLEARDEVLDIRRRFADEPSPA
ncbi:MAG TPA: HD domain-containing phosphohydrolase [Azospirillaceae bacterium]|nr:HD domain-containing phosphohydrolase [Azospirillaceae bacterium]